MSTHKTPTCELSYYGLSLQSYLLDSHPDRAADTDFIRERADLAAEAYSEAIKAGQTHTEAEEIANAELYRGLHFSIYNTLVNILWDEFSDAVPEEEVRSIALQALPLCGSVLATYTLTDDFADTPAFDQLYSELTGIVQILLEYGNI